MRILILGLNYLPESTSIGPYTADLAVHLRRCGHDAVVSTGFPTAPKWQVWEAYRGRKWMREIIDGVPVTRTYLYVPKRPRKALQRILFDCSFALSAFLGNLFSPRADLIVVISPPLQLGLTGWALAILHRAPCFFHIKDLVPDAAVAVGVLREGHWSVRLARALERFIYRRMTGIGVISPGFRSNLLAKGVPPRKVVLLPDYIDPEFIKPEPADNAFRAAHSIPSDVFVAMYSGSVALKQGLQTFIEAAAELREHRTILLYLVGDGPYLQELKALAQKLRLDNLRFLSLQPREMLSTQLAAANALVITQRQAVTDIVFPGKLLYYMAAGRPIIAAVSEQSETGTFISENRVGLVVPPEDPRSLAAAIVHLKNDAAESATLGQNGRRVCLNRFDRTKVLAHFTSHLESVREGRKTPPQTVVERQTATSSRADFEDSQAL